LSRELDLIPDFNQYIPAFTGFGNLVFGVFNQGINQILFAINVRELERLMNVQRQAIEGTIADTQEELKAAVSAQKAAEDEVNAAAARVVEVNNQIQAEMAAMENESLSIGDVIGLVSTVAGAVASVAAAVPTAGASLVALAPRW
jgi:chromosome segregation ATPase